MLYDVACHRRDKVGHYLNHFGLVGMGVEIGTHRGHFASDLLTHWTGRRLFCVDPYLLGYSTDDPISQQDTRLEDIEKARTKLRRYRDRVELIRATSKEALELLKDHKGKLDLVHIDGNHEPEHFEFDLNSWWPYLKTGGALIGHDWLCPGEIAGGWGRYIQPLVNEFAETNNLDRVFLISEENGEPWSFLLRKPAHA